jgi:hypothetical protein
VKTHALRIALLLVCLAAAAPAWAQYQEDTLSANCATISGVAFQSNFSSGTVQIFDGPVLIGTTQGNSDNSFRMQTPGAIKDNRPHQIWAEEVYSGAEIPVYGASGTAIALTCPVNAPGYVYDHTETAFTTTTNSTWQVNGTPPTLSGGFTNASSSGSAVIYKPAVPGVANDYEVKMTLTLLSAGGIYASYLRASSNTQTSPNTGTFYDLALMNPTPGGTGTLSLYQVISGTSTLLASTSVPCHNGMTVRGVMGQNGIFLAYVDNWQYIWLGGITGIASGQPGFGVQSAPAGNAISEGDIGHLDTVAPSAPNMASLALSTAPTRVDMQWAGTPDDANGTGVAMYGIFRNNTLIDWVINPEYEDNSVSASTSYTYYIIACDFAINCTAGTAFNVTTPPAGSIDPRRVGITALAPMWGGTGENIDVRSGNLNYTIPLVKPVGLGGLSVPINLSYNSQFWRQESGTTWRLLNPTGNGVGWMVQA